MNGVEIYQVSFDQFVKLRGDASDVELSAAKLASEIITGIYNGEVLGFVGLVPPTLLSDEAYIWMITTEAGEQHPILLARYGTGLIQTALLKYRELFGHCFNARSARWLKYLGAEFTSETQFVIRRV